VDGAYVDDRVLEHTHGLAVLVENLDVDGGPGAAAIDRGCVLEHVAAASLVVLEAREVVALVHVLENAGENLGKLVGEVDTLGGAGGREELCVAKRGELRRVREDVLVGGEEALGGADADGHDGGHCRAGSRG
jgi:hypothetical protein